MILVIGGLNGFVGSNTTEALVEQGLDCVVTQHKNTEVPRFLQQFIDHHVFVESADATKIEDLRNIGEKHKIDGIVNLGGGFRAPGTKGIVHGLKGYYDMLDATFKMAEEWKVKRLTFSSTGGVYFGLPGPVNEDLPLPLPSPFPIVAYQKIVEVAASEFAKGMGISAICVRLGAMFGPWWDHAAARFVTPILVHAAVNGQLANLEGVWGAFADDAFDLCYIKDVARAIALLQTAENLHRDVYNIGSGRLTSNLELVEAVKSVVPGFKVDLPTGRGPFPPLPVMETKRLHADIGFSPKFDTRSAVQDYVDWLKAGNPK